MQSYSSAVDGKTLIRVGGGHESKVQTAQSNASHYTVKTDHGFPMTSSRRSSVTSSSPVKITSSTISIGDAPVPGAGSTSGAVTVKIATPQKKMMSIIDTKSGVVTSSFPTVVPATSSAGSATLPLSTPTSPTIGYVPATPLADATKALANRRASTASAKSTSVLLTSTTVPATSLDFEETSSSVLMTSSIPMLSPVDVTSSYATMMTSPAPKKASSVVITSMPTSHVAMTTPVEARNIGVVTMAEVHVPPIGFNSENPGNGLDSEDRTSSVSLPDQPGSSRSHILTPSESYTEETGSLIFTDEIDVQVCAGTNMADGDQLPAPDPTEGNPLPASDEKPCDLHSNPSSPPISSAPSSLPTLNASLNPLINPPIAAPPADPSLNPPLSPPSKPRPCAGSITDGAKPDDEMSVITGSESDQQDPPGNSPESTFNFIGWEVASTTDKLVDRKCHRVLIFKDSEIALMFKASCVSETAGHDPRLTALMIDIATNCAKRLKKMKDIILPKLQAEHMDSLPLTDERPTRQHLEEISRDLNENVMINEIAFRFQSTQEESYIGTYVDGSDVQQSPQLSHCQVGRSGVIVVLQKKSRFATVESFSDQLCRHILAARPSSLGRIPDVEVRRLSATKTQVDPEKTQLLLFQTFLSDPSIIVAEAARRSFLRIEDFLLFG